jgi:hypothetical protein
MKYKDYYTHLLNESMTATVSDRDYENEQRQRISGLCYILTDVVITPIFNKLSSEDLRYFNENRVGNILTPDGDDYDKSTGTINFYTSAFKEDVVNKILKGIKYFSKDLNIELGTFRGPEKSRSSNRSLVIRIPVIKNNNISKYVPEINLANLNGRLVFVKLLQLPNFEEPYTISPVDLSKAIKRVEDKIKQDDEFLYRFLNSLSADIKRVGATDFTPLIISQQKTPAYFINILDRLKELVEYAIENGNLDIVIY